MATMFANAVAGGVDRLVRWFVLPVVGVIPWLVETGLLFLGFAALWLAFGVALVTQPLALDDAWRTLAGLPLPVQAIAWLLFLPLTAGLWIWSTDWPLIVRALLVGVLAGWNLLVFFPRRATADPAVAD